MSKNINECLVCDDRLNYVKLCEKYDQLESVHGVLVEDNLTYENQISDLEAKLAEKDEEINVYKKYIKVEDQDKISFALEQLEKVKEHGKSIEKIIYKHYENTKNTNVVSDCHYGKLITISNIVKFIDNQIEELKKEMK